MAKIPEKDSNSDSKSHVSEGGSSSTITSNSNGGKTKSRVKRTRKVVDKDSAPKRTSCYRGVTRHRLTGRYEAHLWDKDCWNESKTKKGRQVYLGAYGEEAAAARAYDLAALKYWGQQTSLNLPLSTYEEELKEMEGQSKEEYIANLRRKSTGFSRGASKYRGVARHHHNGRWEARIGRVYGQKYLYLGTYDTQEEAAIAYDIAAIEYRGRNALTNFDINRYIDGPPPAKKPKIGKDIQVNELANDEQNSNGNLQRSSSSMQRDCDSNVVSCMPEDINHNGDCDDSLERLLKSPKIEEMTETITSASESPQNSAEAEMPRRIFPDDIQTYFDSPGSSGLEDDDDYFIFGELKLLSSPIFHCELE